MSPMLSALILAWIAIALLALACAGMLRQIRELRATIDHGIGTRLTGAPSPGPGSTDGRPVAMPAALASDDPLVLLKVDSKCVECHDAARTLNEVADQRRGEARFVIVADLPLPAWNSSGAVDVITDPETYRSVVAPWSPALVVADRDGVVVSSGPAGNGQVIHQAVDFALRHLAENVA